MSEVRAYSHSELINLAMPRTCLLLFLYSLGDMPGNEGVTKELRQAIDYYANKLSDNQKRIFKLLSHTLWEVPQAVSNSIYVVLAIKAISYLPGDARKVGPYDLMFGKEELQSIFYDVFGEKFSN